MVLGLATTLPHALITGLEQHGLSSAVAHHAAQLPAISVLFAAFLGDNPIQHLLGPHAMAGLSAHNHALLMGRSFFPQLIAAPFRSGLHEAFAFAILACLVAAGASLLRGGRYHAEAAAEAPASVPAALASNGNADEPAEEQVRPPARVSVS
jgi:hypothetical protein